MWHAINTGIPERLYGLTCLLAAGCLWCAVTHAAPATEWVIPAPGKITQPPMPLDASEPVATAREPAEAQPEHPDKAEPAARAATVDNAVLNERLMEATRRGNLGQIAGLMRAGADPDYVEPSGASPALLAVKTGWVELAEVLHEGGAHFNTPNADGTTLLHIAAAAGHVRMAQYLASIGCSLNAKTVKSWTPLHHAARFGHGDMIDFLLEAGVSPNAWNSDGFTPLALAKNARQWEAVRRLTPYTQVSERVSATSPRKLSSGTGSKKKPARKKARRKAS